METLMPVLQIFLQILQILSSIVLVILVLVHSPKGEGIGGIGGAAQVFSSQKGAESALNKITAWAAGTLYAVSFILGYYF